MDKDLNVRPTVIKFSEESIRIKLFDIAHGNIIFRFDIRSAGNKINNKQVGYIKLKKKKLLKQK